MKRQFRCKKGSSLALILIIISILTIIGTAMLSLTLQSYKLRKTESIAKSNLYFSEAGLDVAYAIIGEYVNDAIEDGNNEVDGAMDGFWQWLSNKEAGKVTPEDVLFKDYIDGEGNIINEKINEYKDAIFKTAFKTYISGNNNTNNNSKNINGNLENLKSDIDKNNANTSVKIVNKEVPTFDIHTDEMDLILESKFKHEDIEKIIRVTCTIHVPDYEQTNVSANKYVKLYENPVWSKAITADGNMLLENGRVNINSGDIYIKGIYDNKEKAEGVILKNDNSSIISNGNVITAADINYKAKGDKSNENISVKNVYARNIFVDNESLGANIKVSDSVYLLDDMEINGSKYNIHIEKGFYGVSDGSLAANNNPDNSSSIIINTDDIEKDSNIKIEGNTYIAGTSYIRGLNPSYQTGESVSIKGNYRAYTQSLLKDNHVFRINGKDRDLKKDVKFNYYAPLSLVSEYVNREPVGEVTAAIESVNYEEKRTSLTINLSEEGLKGYSNAKKFIIAYNDDKGNGKKTIMQDIGTSIEIDKVFEKTDNIEVELYAEDNSYIDKKTVVIKKELVDALTKSKYFKAYQDDYGKNSGLILGTGKDDKSGIKLKGVKEKIHLGALLTGVKDNPVEVGNWIMQHTKKIKAKRIQLKDKLFFMNYAESISIDNNSELIDDVDTIDDTSQILDDITSSESTKKKYSSIDNKSKPYIVVKRKNSSEKELVDFTVIPSGGYREGLNTVGNSSYNINPSNEYNVLLDKSNESFALIGNNGDANIKADNKVYLNGNTFNGIIVTDGDIYFTGEVNFTGTIITSGNIKFYGNSQKKFNYNETLIKRILAEKFDKFSEGSVKGFKDLFINSSKNSSYIEIFDKNVPKYNSISTKDWVIIK